MFLLIPRHLLETPSIPETDTTDILDNLFDIRLGLIEDRYLHLTSDKKEPVYFITAKSFTNVPNTKDQLTFVYNEWEQLKNLDPDWTKAIENGNMLKENQEKDLDESGKISERKGYIKENRLLQQHDFLISIRGEPRGYSMLKLDQLKRYNIVASHYFEKLTPRYPGKFNLEYLHIIMEQFAKHKLVDNFKYLQKESRKKGKSYASFNSFSVEDLKDQKIEFHGQIEKQKEIAVLYREQFEKWHKQNLIFNQFEINIFNAINGKPDYKN